MRMYTRFLRAAVVCLLIIFLAKYSTRYFLSKHFPKSTFSLPYWSSYNKLCGVSIFVNYQIDSYPVHRPDTSKIVMDELLQIVEHRPIPQCNATTSNTNTKLLLILVTSARPNFSARRLVRQTWGSMETYKNWKIYVRFLLGQTSVCLQDPQNWTRNMESYAFSEEAQLRIEQREWGDLVIGSFADTYRNLTYKTLLGYKYVVSHCPAAALVIKTDDDIFVDVPSFIDRKSQEIIPYNLYCRRWSVKPTRCRNCENGAFYTSYDEWPHDTYPEYCVGGGYATTVEWMQKVWSVRSNVRLFWLEDLFLTGILREAVERNTGENATILDISDHVTMTKDRNNFEPDCQKYINNDDMIWERKFGWIVFLRRKDILFEKYMDCLWRKSLTTVNMSEISWRVERDNQLVNARL